MTLATLQERRSALDAQRATLVDQHQAAITTVTETASTKAITAARQITNDMAVIDQAQAALDQQIADALQAEQEAAQQAAAQAVITDASALASEMRECREQHDEAMISLTILLGRELHRLADIRVRWRAAGDAWVAFARERLPSNSFHASPGRTSDETRDQAILDELAAQGVNVGDLMLRLSPWGGLEQPYTPPINGAYEHMPTPEQIYAGAALDVLGRADTLARVRPVDGE